MRGCFRLTNGSADIFHLPVWEDSDCPIPTLSCSKIEMWVFPKIVVSQNGWFIMENPIKMGDLGVPLFLETPKCSSSIRVPLGTSQSLSAKGGAVLDPSEDAFDAVHVGVGDRAAQLVRAVNLHRIVGTCMYKYDNVHVICHKCNSAILRGYPFRLLRGSVNPLFFLNG